MSHEIDDQLFEKYMNGELEPRAQAEFEAHIKDCRECAGRYAAFVKIKRGLSSMGDEPLPGGFRQEWTHRVHSYGSRSKNAARRMGKYLPAVAAGVVAVVVLSAVMLSGTLSPGSLLSQTRVAGNGESQIAAESALQDNAAKDAAPENEEAGSPESASLFMAQEAPAESAAPEMSGEASSAARADKTAIPLYVTQETFAALTKLLVDEDAEFCLDENLLIVSVTEQNQADLSKFAQDYALGISPLPGETYEVWVAE